jgi:hypothetical protein
MIDPDFFGTAFKIAPEAFGALFEVGTQCFLKELFSICVVRNH